MPNRLAGETSPYLLQHADNPVDWHAWNEASLSLARRENRPILLSIGYSACHWCHVMAHESFEDEATAAVMNRHFVNIKVDREERPDLDHIYQLAHQMLQQRPGGWPLTVFLTPDGTPFFTGTYFPKQPRHGLPAFVDLLEHVADVFTTRRDDIETQNASMRAALAQRPPPAIGVDALDATPVAAACELLARSYDRRWGGFGGAPKFPRPSDLDLLLRHGSTEQRAMALETLRRMADGGLYDQLGGGFCRYSVDERWEIPHFEKMLYDNGPLLRLYADAWALTGELRFRQVVEETAAWVMREMQSPAGGYYSALDADSEGEEGRFYVWTPAEIQALLEPDAYAVVAMHYGLDAPANFEGHAWHLRIAMPLENVAAELGISRPDAEARLNAARASLFAARERRIRPGCDDKSLCSWNALMIEGMAHAARVFDRTDWLTSAERALAFVRSTLWVEGRLLATARHGRAHLNAYLDDHAFMIAALLELLQARYRAEDVEFARALADLLLTRFEDVPAGGFLFTSHDHEQLVCRPRSGHDNALPSGNGVAAHALQRLAMLLDEPRYALATGRALRAFWQEFATHPAGASALLLALAEFCMPPRLVVLRGPQEACTEWLRSLSQRHLPSTLLVAIPSGMTGLPATLDKPAGETVNAWVCENVSCLPPVTSLESLTDLLGDAV